MFKILITILFFLSVLKLAYTLYLNVKLKFHKEEIIILISYLTCNIYAILWVLLLNGIGFNNMWASLKLVMGDLKLIYIVIPFTVFNFLFNDWIKDQIKKGKI